MIQEKHTFGCTMICLSVLIFNAKFYHNRFRYLCIKSISSPVPPLQLKKLFRRIFFTSRINLAEIVFLSKLLSYQDSRFTCYIVCGHLGTRHFQTLLNYLSSLHALNKIFRYKNIFLTKSQKEGRLNFLQNISISFRSIFALSCLPPYSQKQVMKQLQNVVSYFIKELYISY